MTEGQKAEGRRQEAGADASAPASDYAGLPPPGAPLRFLGIDYGTRRLGLAVGDTVSGFVTPLEVAQITTPEQAAERVVRAANEQGADALVVGLPLNMDDTEGPAARDVRDWAVSLRAKTGLPVLFIDERLSSFEAEQSLVERKRQGHKLTRQGKKKRLDALAAGVILRGFLEGQLHPQPGSDSLPGQS